MIKREKRRELGRVGAVLLVLVVLTLTLSGCDSVLGSTDNNEDNGDSGTEAPEDGDNGDGGSEDPDEQEQQSVMIAASDPSLGEGETSTITLTPDTPFENGAVLTPTFGGTAQKETHYTVSGLDGDGTIEIAGGQPNKEFTINAADDLSALSGDVEIEVGLDDSSGEYNAGTSITITLSAGGAYSVIYRAPNKTGGSVPTDSNTYSDGDTATLLGNTGDLVSTGYVFEGWWDSEDTDQSASRDGSGLYQAGSSVDIDNDDYTVYAQWRDPRFGYFPGTRDDGFIPENETAYSAGTTVTLAENTGDLARNDYTFIGWNTSEDGSGTFYAPGDTFPMPGEDFSVYPDWAPHRSWEDVAVSSNGTYMAAVERTGSIWLSTDSGATWTENTAAGKALWERVDISDDGQTIVAVKDAGLAWSTDGGSSWDVDNSAAYRDASLFADGNADGDLNNTKIVAIRQGQIGVSDVGASLNWTDVDVNTDANDDVWEAVVGNHEDTGGASGKQYLLAAITRGDGTSAKPAKIYVGTYDETGTTSYDGSSWSEASVQVTSDNGSSWSATDPPYLSDVAISSDGQHLAAATGLFGSDSIGDVFVSTDSGQIWKEHYGLENRWYSSITISDDGNTVFVVSNGNSLYNTDPGLWRSINFTSLDNPSWERYDDESTDDMFEVSDSEWGIAASTGSSETDRKLVASQYDGNLFISTDGGASWELKE